MFREEIKEMVHRFFWARGIDFNRSIKIHAAMVSDLAFEVGRVVHSDMRVKLAGDCLAEAEKLSQAGDYAGADALRASAVKIRAPSILELSGG
ncbi:MAG: hypothetical protein IBX56_12400 [Methylomicrobium sp.]|nr:hypothetical protein [Methylomicrobium sp.]